MVRDGRLRWGMLGALAPIMWCACAQDISVSDSGDEESRDAAVVRDGGATDGGGTDGGAGDATADGGGAGDATAGDAQGAGDAAPPDGGELACHGDPFQSCEDLQEAAQRNDTWPYATDFNDNMTVGCFTADDLTALMRTQSAVICPQETADYYDLTLVGCDTRTMFAELRLHVTTECDPAEWNLVFLAGGGVVDCNSGRYMIQCLEDNGDKVIRLRVPPDRSVFSWQFAIETTRAELKLDYQLSLDLH